MAYLTEAMQKVSLVDGKQDQRILLERAVEVKRENAKDEEVEDREEEEEEEEEEGQGASFSRFFDLPMEIRLQIYKFVLFSFGSRRRPGGSVGASSKNMAVAPLSHRVSLFLASRRIHDEASRYFYSTMLFRLFPVQDYSRLPTVRGLSPRYRNCLSKVELILGSSWTKPPASWTVNNSLGLRDMKKVVRLCIFIETDPSHPIFDGFRISKGFYTQFAGDLVHNILKGLPGLMEVEFDGYPSVQKNGDLMKRLIMEAKRANKKIRWGPQRGWTNYDFQEIVQEEQIQDLVT